ncbi:chromatin accessibility complex 16kD protein [Bacillus rossius redtenbacheri]|uniref:chromatin accessibility complex 16kD protein n=1 Tax=Bacillus rossius redtenbacheri TaxID=93214 RepID=UPI002FDE5FA5
MTTRSTPTKNEERLYCEELFRELKLPADRIKTVMRSSPDVEKLTTDSLYIMTKATEMFIRDLARRAHASSGKENTIDYKHIADVVQSESAFEFVREMVPHKITFRQYKEMKRQKDKLKKGK